MRSIMIVLVLFIYVTATPVAWADTTGSSGNLIDKLQHAQGHAPIYSASCCKTCRKGKACGNSCISKTKSCRKAGGCACDG